MIVFEPDQPHPLNIALLAGGESSERSISIASGDAVERSLADRGHGIIRLDPADIDLSTYCWDGIDGVFIALHGAFGEDGQVQKILERAQIPYTGSNSVASRLAFHKSAAKERFFQNYVPTPPYVLIHESDTAAAITNKARSLGYPLVVKPDAQGSSLGVSLVDAPDDLAAGLTCCFHLDAFGLLESAIMGTEWTVGILDNMTLPLVQVQTDKSIFNYRAKYEDESTKYLFEFEFDVTLDVVSSINRTARNAYSALGMSGLARVDIMLDSYQRPWVLEVNNIPGLTDHSLVPRAAARIGLSLGQLCEQMLESCLKATPQR